MNFEHTEDRRMLADTLNRFVSEQYGFETRNAIAYGDVGMAPALWNQFAELGAIGALFAEDDGGFGGAGFDIAVVFEALGRGLVVEPFLGALMVGRALAAVGTSAQKALIANLVDGSSIAALAHDEPGSHYELSRVATRAERNADGWTLSGAKAVVLQGDHANLLLVSARTSGEVDSEDGISLFLVPADAAGLSRRGMGRMDGGRVAEITLDKVQVGADALLGAEGRGLATLEVAVGAGVLALCAEAVGAMEVAKRDTLEYLQTRKQFGVAIGSFQALQHRMADMYIHLEQARSMAMLAAARMSCGDPGERRRIISAAKVRVGQAAKFIGQQAVQLHGGMGVTDELPAAHHFKRLAMIELTLGDIDHHLERYTAQSAFQQF